jgi:hypothetical protein
VKFVPRPVRVARTCAAASVLFALEARAADHLCLPEVVGVPGMSKQAPDWSSSGGPFAKSLDDPRWTGAVREDFPIFGGGSKTEVAFRGLFQGTKVYLSFQALVDDGVTDGLDAVYIGFASSATSARILKITLLWPGELAGDTTPTNRGLATWKWEGAGWASTGLPDAWATASNAMALWSVQSSSWAVQVVFDTSGSSDLGVALGGPVTAVWYQVARYHAAFPSPELTARHKWPFASDAFDEAIASNDVGKWAALHRGTDDASCPAGISLTPQRIGTTPITGGIPSNVVRWGTPTSTDTFVALPAYPGSAPAAGTIEGTFRMANFASQFGDATADWKNLLPSSGSVASDAQGNLSFTCTGTSGSTACPSLAAGAPTDQCLLVQLSAGGTGLGLGAHFVHDSATACIVMKDDAADAGLDGAAEAGLDDAADAGLDGAAEAGLDGTMEAGLDGAAVDAREDVRSPGADAMMPLDVAGDTVLDTGASPAVDASGGVADAPSTSSGGCGCEVGRSARDRWWIDGRILLLALAVARFTRSAWCDDRAGASRRSRRAPAPPRRPLNSHP